MADAVGDEMQEIECKVEHSTAKAWLVIDNMSGNQAWLPKSIGTMMSEGPDPEGNTLFQAPTWWCRKNKFI